MLAKSTVKPGTAVLVTLPSGPWTDCSAYCSTCGWRWISFDPRTTGFAVSITVMAGKKFSVGSLLKFIHCMSAESLSRNFTSSFSCSSL